ncbi:hypothetical protein PQR62_25510 [Herbaspirillum lusitanum]|uniref:Uncharacterized protein n=1 Tax=Herbaspirillum lusitanum TaxID=213312 RepID=A0ABW9AHB7_9BURK
MTEARRADQITRNRPDWITIALSIIIFILGVLPCAPNAEQAGNALSHRANLGVGCHIQAHIPSAGTLDGSYNDQTKINGGGFKVKYRFQKNQIEELPINIECVDVDNGRVNNGWARFDEYKNRWEAYFSGDDEDRRLLAPVTKVYQIQAINSRGYVITIDQTYGAPESRDRNMHFCLLRPPKALCGEAPVMRLNTPQNNALPYVLEVLKSVEFIDD